MSVASAEIKTASNYITGPSKGQNAMASEKAAACSIFHRTDPRLPNSHPYARIPLMFYLGVVFDSTTLIASHTLRATRRPGRDRSGFVTPARALDYRDA
jgi:hypothetical protein